LFIENKLIKELKLSHSLCFSATLLTHTLKGVVHFKITKALKKYKLKLNRPPKDEKWQIKMTKQYIKS